MALALAFLGFGFRRWAQYLLLGKTCFLRISIFELHYRPLAPASLSNTICRASGVSCNCGLVASEPKSAWASRFPPTSLHDLLLGGFTLRFFLPSRLW